MVAKEIRLSANGIGKRAPGAHSTGEGIPGSSRSDPGMRRRELLISTAMTLVFSATSARALVVKGSLPWAPSAGTPPTAVHPGPWVYFTPEEGAAIEALVDRLIPPDPQTPGGKDARSSLTDNLRDPMAAQRGSTCTGPSPTERRSREISRR